MPELEWKKKAIKQLDKLPDDVACDIEEKVSGLKNWPDIRQLIVEKLTDDKQKRLKLVVGNYRVLWKLIKGQPVIIEIHEVRRRTTTTYKKR